MKRRIFLAGLGLLVASPGWAGLVETIPRVKPSVVAVGTFLATRNPQFQFLGTGFVVGDGNQVATNSHVANAALDKREVEERLVIALPTTGKVAVRPVEVEASAPEFDLAVLRFKGPSLPPLPLAEEEDVREGQDVALTGFPLGGSIGIIPVTHKGIVAAITPLGQPVPNARDLQPGAIRRLSQGSYPVLQLDIVSYPGNSGSPLYAVESGLVVGVLNMTFVKGMKENAISAPSGISYAIPVSRLKALLKR
ncbi:serine protease [Zoogloea sp.]|uniref:S1 family peptidase n=1 Tax=Zoogloea sp. TaxID=49181 RepID=UPI0026081B96|nr:serine protease [Zoogloea sp.]MDD3354486.1 serine protease [Zoogloea sp.]